MNDRKRLWKGRSISPLSVAVAVFGCALLLAACSPGAIQFQPLPDNEETPFSSDAPVVEAVAAEAVPSATVGEENDVPSEAPSDDTLLEGAALFNQRALNDMDFLIVIETSGELPQDVTDKLTVAVNEKPWRCMVLEQFKNRLYCVGTPPETGVEARVSAYTVDPEKPLFSASFTPEEITAPVQPTTVQVDMGPTELPTPTATEGPTGGGGEGTGSGVENVQPGGAIGGGREEMGGGIAPTSTPDPNATDAPVQNIPVIPVTLTIPVDPASP